MNKDIEGKEMNPKKPITDDLKKEFKDVTNRSNVEIDKIFGYLNLRLINANVSHLYEVIEEYEKNGDMGFLIDLVGSFHLNSLLTVIQINNEGSQWVSLFKKLKEAYCDDRTDRMDNHRDYNPKRLETKSLEELERLYEELIDYEDAIHTFNEIANDEGWAFHFDD